MACDRGDPVSARRDDHESVEHGIVELEPGRQRQLMGGDAIDLDVVELGCLSGTRRRGGEQLSERSSMVASVARVCAASWVRATMISAGSRDLSVRPDMWLNTSSRHTARAG